MKCINLDKKTAIILRMFQYNNIRYVFEAH